MFERERGRKGVKGGWIETGSEHLPECGKRVRVTSARLQHVLVCSGCLTHIQTDYSSLSLSLSHSFAFSLTLSDGDRELMGSTVVELQHCILSEKAARDDRKGGGVKVGRREAKEVV
jgi:hypothetical protein